MEKTKKRKKGRYFVVIKEGTVLISLAGIFIVGVLYYSIYTALKGKIFEMRRMPVLDAVEDGIDRAVEMGRPVFHSLGAYAYLSGQFVAMTISGVNLMRYSMRSCVRKDATIRFCLPCNPEVGPLIDGIYREVCVAEGKPEAYNRHDIYYFGNDEAAYRAGLLNLLAEDPPASYTLCGAVTGTGDTIATYAARSLGSMVIGGQCRHTHQGIFLAFDYYMPLADNYAAGVIVGEDQVRIATLWASDVVSYLALIMIIVSLVAAFAGAPILDWLKI
jgi:hypothetical protein